MKNGQMSSELNEVSLSCEHCGNGWLHQEQVEIYKGPEDWYHTRVVCDKAGGVTVDEHKPRNNSRNPSPRRDGVRIVFSCEQCGGFTNLMVFQHKGQEFLQTCKDGERLASYVKV